MEQLQIHINSRNSIFEFSDSHRIFAVSSMINFDRYRPIYIELTSCEIPFSWYVIDASNNILNLSIDGVPQTLTLASGNFDTDEIAAAFNAAFTGTVQCAYNSNTNKMTLTYTGHTISVLPTSTALDLFGFTSGVTHSGISTLVSDKVCDIQRVEKIFVSTNFPVPNQSCTTEAYGGILASFVPNASFYGTNTYAGTHYKFRTNPCIIDQITVHIMNEAFQDIDFNNAAWSLTLTIYF